MHKNKITIYNEPFATTNYYNGEYVLDGKIYEFTVIANTDTNLDTDSISEIQWLDGADEILLAIYGDIEFTNIELEIHKLYDHEST